MSFHRWFFPMCWNLHGEYHHSPYVWRPTDTLIFPSKSGRPSSPRSGIASPATRAPTRKWRKRPSSTKSTLGEECPVVVHLFSWVFHKWAFQETSIYLFNPLYTTRDIQTVQLGLQSAGTWSLSYANKYMISSETWGWSLNWSYNWGHTHFLLGRPLTWRQMMKT